jgi:hypothetical protein
MSYGWLPAVIPSENSTMPGAVDVAVAGSMTPIRFPRSSTNHIFASGPWVICQLPPVWVIPENSVTVPAGAADAEPGNQATAANPISSQRP